MKDYPAPIPEQYPCDIDKSVTEQQLDKIFSDNIKRLIEAERKWREEIQD